MYNYNDIEAVHLEITQKCQAACPMCDRNENGGVDNRHITNAELSFEDCQSIFTPAFINQLKTMYMCGNLGDPIVAKDIAEIIEIIPNISSENDVILTLGAGDVNKIPHQLKEHFC